MKSSNKKNFHVVWIIIDSVRRYHTDDDRTRLKFMDEFSRNAVEFSNVVTSAPSTVMSISAMMNSLPAYFIGRNYNDFRFDNEFFLSLPQYLKLFGYKSKALLMHPDIREKLTFFDLVPKKYWPAGFSHGDWWSNAMILKLLKNCLKYDNAQNRKPTFWFVDYNCREDKNISSIVDETVSTFNQNGYCRENTIFIICSDHGYPDPSRGITPKLLKEKNMTHDIFMTDDNIMIPLLLSYPGCNEGLKIKETISSLDIAPTILDLLGIEPSVDIKRQWQGKTLTPILTGETKVVRSYPLVRTDARFFGQSGRVSSIRGDEFKYVYFHDEKKEEFYLIGESVEDEQKITGKKLKNFQNEFDRLRAEFRKTEAEGLSSQLDYLIHKLKKQKGSFAGIDKNKKLTVLILTSAPQQLIDLVLKALKSSFNLGSIHLFTETVNLKNLHAEEVYSSLSEIKAKSDLKFDIVFFTSEMQTTKSKMLVKKIKKIVRTKKTYELDLNMNVSIKQGQINRYLRTLWFNRTFFIQEPLLVFKEIRKIINLTLKQFR